MIRAASGGNNTLQFDHDIYVKGGVSKKNVVLATKMFLAIPLKAIQDYGSDIVM